jgi:hypothetical protein
MRRLNIYACKSIFTSLLVGPLNAHACKYFVPLLGALFPLVASECALSGTKRRRLIRTARKVRLNFINDFAFQHRNSYFQNLL